MYTFKNSFQEKLYEKIFFEKEKEYLINDSSTDDFYNDSDEFFDCLDALVMGFHAIALVALKRTKSEDQNWINEFSND